MRFIGLDPSTKTGFVALDYNGNVLKAKELTGIGDKDPKRMITLIDEVVAHIQKDDLIVIEGFPFDTQRAMFAGGLHHGIRNELFKRGLKYYEVAPNSVKKYVNETGWAGEPGNKRRLKGKEKKLAVMAAVEKHFNFVHSSDNVVDAYIMAQIARNLYGMKNIGFLLEAVPKYQEEVLEAILNPPTKKPKKKKVKS